MKKIILFIVISLNVTAEKKNLISGDIIQERYVELPIVSNIIFVESQNNDSAYCAKEDAVGCLQIRRVMVDDINRILKEKKYSYHDRWSRKKSIEMFNVFCKHYNLETDEEKARCWNGGPFGCEKESTKQYWKRVEDAKLNS